MTVEQFTITIPDTTIAELQHRLRATRWTDRVAEGWDYGADVDYLSELTEEE